jgi:hypothetical protein
LVDFGSKLVGKILLKFYLNKGTTKLRRRRGFVVPPN